MRAFFLLATTCITMASQAQVLTTTPSGDNKRAMVAEQVGLTWITIKYNRPGVKEREGKIWGELVPVGYTNQGFGTAVEAPWRAGANENTTIHFDTDVKIEGKPLPAGRYGLFIAFDPEASTLIFSRNSTSWGSYYYNKEEDALRVPVKPKKLDHREEWLSYNFSDQTRNAATIELKWEKLAIPFRVETDLLATQLAIFRKELRTEKGFTWQAWDQAAQWAVNNNTNLDEALKWADSASGRTFGGNYAFQPQVTKSQVLEKLGRTREASEVRKKALPLANTLELHQYGRRLVQQKRPQEALEVFKMNYSRNPTDFTTMVGMTRGYSAVGDFKNALSFARKALPVAPDELNKQALAGMIKKLEEGKDVN